MTHENPILPIRYQDEQLIIVDKPSGLAAQSTRDPDQPHVYGLLSSRFPYVGLHHRLDTPASGLMLLTLHRGANKAIARAFREHQIMRDYWVVVLGDPGPEGVWSGSLDGKRALSRFKRLQHGPDMSLLQVSLETGRTHQIRRHALAAGHPVIGDRRHGGAAGRLWPRLALHAAALSLTHPVTGERLNVASPWPDDLQSLIPRVSD